MARVSRPGLPGTFFVLALLLSEVLATQPGADPAVLTYRVLAEYPHDPKAFTQGLVHDKVCDSKGRACKDVFCESTGLNGRSSVRQTTIAGGKVLMSRDVNSTYFAEGLTRINGTLYQLTWLSGTGFMYSTKDLSLLGTFKTELPDGWGLANNGTHLMATDSSSTLSWIDPATFKTVRSVQIRDGNQPLPWVNEIEYINGELWGNVWKTECIARINVTTGRVTHWMLLTGLRDKLLKRSTAQSGPLDVLNGIAWDNATQRLYVTGKLWPSVFRVAPQPFLAGRAPTLAEVRKMCHPVTSTLKH